MKNHTRLLQFIESSSLAEPDKTVVGSFFQKANDEDLVSVVQALEQSPTLLPKIVENIKAKTFVLGSDQNELWDRILQEEEQLLQV